MKDKKGISIS